MNVPETGEQRRQLVHTRAYDVAAYREPGDRLRVVGRVHDQKPPGIYIEGDDQAVSIHDMVLELVVAHPGLVIVDAQARMDTHPHLGCPNILPDYGKLVGLSVARGFSPKVLEALGGPRGCAHITALVLAMAPVVIQSLWVFRQEVEPLAADASPEEIVERYRFNQDTCHVWAHDGEVFDRMRAGEAPGISLPVRERLVQLGRDPSTWVRR
ncbi:MAG: DUF2889 domain-containing protein [Acidimicrobiales bacterium]